MMRVRPEGRERSMGVKRGRSRRLAIGCIALALVPGAWAVSARQAPQAPPATAKYDLLLRGAHVIDARNKLSAVRDVAIAAGKIAEVAANINPADAVKTVELAGM